MDLGDEILHLVKHAAQQQSGDYRPFMFAHIASYDPAKHRVRLVVPSLGDEGNNYVLTGWMPLGLVGGIQVAPKGGATATNPTGGEPCVVGIIEGERGSLFCASVIYNNVATPAFTDLKGGEVGIKAGSGTFIRMSADNSITIDSTANNGVVNVKAGSGQVNVTSTGKVVVGASEVDLNGNTVITGNLNVTGTITWPQGSISGTGVTVQGTITATSDVTAGLGGGDQVGLRSHVHAGVQTGGGSTASPTAGT